MTSGDVFKSLTKSFNRSPKLVLFRPLSGVAGEREQGGRTASTVQGCRLVGIAKL